MRLARSAAAAVMALTSCWLCSQSFKTPVERLHDAAALAKLDTPGLRPWHLKLDVTVSDENGKNSQQGTIEVWHTDTSSLTTMSFGASASTVLRNESGSYSQTSGGDISYLADVILQSVLDPGPPSDEVSVSHPELRKEGSGKEAMDCVMLTQPIPHVAFAPLGLFPTYCMVRDTDRLAITYNVGSQTVVRSTVGKFQERQVPTKLFLQSGSVVLATAAITTLSSFSPTPNQFEPTPEMKKAGLAQAKISSGVMAGNILRKVPPVYPASAKLNHASGTVTLRAWIGRDGLIHALRPMSAPDPDLVIAAIAAVRQWTYKPYLLNGEPTSVDTTIIVNFNLSPN